MTIKNLLSWADEQLAKTSDSSQLDAELILAKILKISRTQLLTRELDNVPLWQRWYFYYLIRQRQQDYPVAYLLGYKEFYGRHFKVNKHVLIPRPESELIIEEIKKRFSPQQAITIADTGTGSGCLAIILALEFANGKIYAGDISRAALKTAKNNSRQHQTSSILFKIGNLLESFNKIHLDIIIANLPYVTLAEYQRHPMLKFEPQVALLEQPNLFTQFCQQASQHQETKLIIIETSPLLINQWRATARLYWAEQCISTILDYSQKPRFIIISQSNIT